MKRESVWAGIADAFVRPFSKGNLKRFLLGLLFLIVPFLFFIADGDAYLMAAGRGRKFGDRVRMGLKILLVRLLYAGPVLLIYGIDILLCSYFSSMPLLVSILIVFLLCLFIIRFLILSPVAACCLALGAPMKIAASGREMKRIVSGSLGRYLLYALIAFLIPASMGLFILDLSYLWQFAAAVPFALLYTYIGAGLFMSCCRCSLDLPVPPRGKTFIPAGAAMRAAAFGMAFILLLTASPLEVLAKGVSISDRPQQEIPLESGGGYKLDNSFKTYREAYEYGQEHGLLTKFNEIKREDGGTFTIASRYGVNEDHADINKAIDSGLIICDTVLDFVPVVGNIKNGIQVVYYSYKAYTAKTEEARDEAIVAASYKVVGLALGGLGKAVKAAQAGKGCLWMKTMLGASKLEKSAKLLQYTDDGKQVYDLMVSGLGIADVETGREDSTGLSPYGLLVGGKFMLEQSFGDRFERADYPKNVVIFDNSGGGFTGYVIPDVDNSSIGGDTVILEPAETLPPEGIVIVDADWLDKSNPKGTYACTMVRATLTNATVPGISYHMAPATVYVTIDDNLTAAFDTVMDLTVSYDMAGIKMNMKSNVRLTQKLLQGEVLPTGEMITYTFTDTRDVVIDTTYSGQGYEGGGGSVQTKTRTEYTVTFYLSGYRPTLTSDPVWKVDGTISIKPVVGEEGGMAGLDQSSTIEFSGTLTR